MNIKTQKYDSTRGSKSLKLLDRYLGIPIILLLSFFKRKRKKPIDFSHVGLLKTGAIGDTVLMLGILQDIYEEYPNIKVTVFVGSSNACMAEFMPSVDVVTLPVTNPLKSIAMIRKKKCDIIIDFGQWPRLDALLSAYSGALFSIGFQTSNQSRSLLYDVAVPHNKLVHEYKNFKSLVAEIGIQRENIPNISLARERQQKGTIAIHMFPGGSQAELKKWPFERWIELIDLLAAEGLKIVLTGAKADLLTAEELKVQVKQPEQVFIKAGTTLRETCDELYDSALVISVDTGIVHIAAALGCNIVSLHGPSPVSRWGPISDKATCLTPSDECLGCVYLGFEPCTKQRYCIRDITVEHVKNAVEKSLSAQSSVLDANHKINENLSCP